MAAPFSPRPIQVPAIQFMGEHERCAVWADVGVGKTSAVLSHLQTCYGPLGETEPTLIVGPKRVARDVWTDDLAKWSNMPALEISTCIGTLEMRKAALRRDVPIITINYDNLPWLVKYLDGKWPFARVVADEASRLRGFRLKQGGAQTAALGRYAHTRVRSFIELTGTPAPNGLKNVWGQTWFLDGGRRLGLSYSSFMERWFQAVPGGDGYTQVRPLAHAAEEIKEKIKDLCLTLDPRDWYDMREPIVNVIEVELPAPARHLYRQMERELYIALENGEDVEAPSAGVKYGKCRQLASGAVLLDADKHGKGQWREVHAAKLEALDSVLTEANGMPILVGYHYKSDRERILKAFPAAVDLATDAGMAAFKAGKSPMGIGHPKSMGHGVDGLQYVTNIVVFFSLDADLELHDQLIGRIGPMRQLQAGLDRPVFVHYLCARATVDEDVLDLYETKTSVQEALKNGMKRRLT